MKYILSTHYHDDHIDGITQLFRYGFTAGEYLHPYGDVSANRNERMKNTLCLAQKNGVPARRVGHGDALTLGGAQIQVLRCLEVPGENAASLVLKVTFGENSMLLCADISNQVQEYFAAHLAPELLDADLIKAPHHGINRIHTDFLNAVSPEAVVITSLPDLIAEKLKAQLESRNLPYVFSGCGTVCVVTDGTDWYIDQALRAF